MPNPQENNQLQWKKKQLITGKNNEEKERKKKYHKIKIGGTEKNDGMKGENDKWLNEEANAMSGE